MELRGTRHQLDDMGSAVTATGFGVPRGCGTTQPLFRDVIAFCGMTGISADPYQQAALRKLFPADLAVAPAAVLQVSARSLSSRRGLFRQAVLAWLYLGGEHVLWVTAHPSYVVQAMADIVGAHRMLSSRVRKVCRLNGSEHIALKSGACVEFRVPRVVKGIAVSKVVFDYEPDDVPPPEVLQRLLPSLAVARSPQLLAGPGCERVLKREAVIS